MRRNILVLITGMCTARQKYLLIVYVSLRQEIPVVCGCHVRN